MKRFMKKIYWIVCVVLTMIIPFSIVHARGTILLPETGQAGCYDTNGNMIDCEGTGQDGEIQAGVEWPNPRFKIIYCNASGPCADPNLDCDNNVSTDMVMDHLTGLVWARDGNLLGDYIPWKGALDNIASINSGRMLCGYNDWRLPNAIELESLINAGEPDTAVWLNSQGFDNVQSDHYWSSTANAFYQDPARVVNMGYGHVTNGSNTNYRHTWSVRSGQRNLSDRKYPANLWKTGQTAGYAIGDDGDLERGVRWPDPRFTDHGDETVTDHLTGLMWTKDANSSGSTLCNPAASKTWQEALDYVVCLNTNRHLGFTDWRFPNRKELFSLIDHSKYGPALPEGHPFLYVQFLDDYWSSTTVASFTDSAWTIDMFYGNINHDQKRYRNYVWPVRNGVGLPGPNLTGLWTSPLIETCRSTPIGSRCTIKGTLTLQNVSYRRTSYSHVIFYLSDDGTYDENDVFLTWRVTGKIEGGDSKKIDLSYRFPLDITASGKYIIAVIDQRHMIEETKETDNLIVFGPLP